MRQYVLHVICTASQSPDDLDRICDALPCTQPKGRALGSIAMFVVGGYIADVSTLAGLKA
ncbi:hypothetical protein DPMN_043266 [Dreissena polymorpha]|uniref:Uncharacterized protein n=1 Tax=Dreissena polymorpha TaxID=45954 RepID=A0A9D4D063_DREPO|nr:hypothetical protein DPMN_043266 [Dreissena polymorpha]